MTAQPPHNNRPDKPEGIKNMRKYLGLPENDPDNQADWLDAAITHYVNRPLISEDRWNDLKQAITTKIAEERLIELKNLDRRTGSWSAKDKLRSRIKQLEAALSQDGVSDLPTEDSEPRTGHSDAPK